VQVFLRERMDSLDFSFSFCCLGYWQFGYGRAKKGFWSTDFSQFLKVYYTRQTELTKEGFNKWRKELVGKKVKWKGLVEKLEHPGNVGGYTVELQTHLDVVNGKVQKEPYGWKITTQVPLWEGSEVERLVIDEKVVVVGTIESVYSPTVRLKNPRFIKLEREKIRGEGEKEKYDYLLPLGSVSILKTEEPVVVVDRRNGSMWGLFWDPEAEEWKSEYVGRVEEFFRKIGEPREEKEKLKKEEGEPEEGKEKIKQKGREVELGEKICSTDFLKFRDECIRRREKLTEVEFKKWKKGLLGKKVRWTGQVVDVRRRYVRYEVVMDLTPEDYWKEDVWAYFCEREENKVLGLRKGQQVEFVAAIRDIRRFGGWGRINVVVEDVEFVQ